MKNCVSCGKENGDDAVFCAGCGTPLPQAPAPEEPAPEVMPEAAVQEEPALAAAPVTADEPASQAPSTQPDAYAYTPPAAPAESNKATLWLILNIVATVLCCCANVFGIVGIIFAGIGMSSYKKGDYEDMNKKTKIAKIMFIIAAVFVVVGWIVAAVSPLLAMVPFLSDISTY